MADAFPKFRPPELAEIAVSHDGLPFWQFMVAGSVAGVVEHTAMFPVDTLKTRMQAQRPPCRPPASLRQVLSGILKLEGPRSLYRGITAMGFGAGPAHAVYFSVYEASKELLSGRNPDGVGGAAAAHAVSGVAATGASDAVLTPADTVKQRLQLRESPYRGAMDCVRKLLREEGTRAFFVSYRTTVVMNAPFTAVHFSTYEAAKRALKEVSPATGGQEERLVVHASRRRGTGRLRHYPSGCGEDSASVPGGLRLREILRRVDSGGGEEHREEGRLRGAGAGVEAPDALPRTRRRHLLVNL